MKLTKYIMVACAGLLMAACSSDDWNTDSNVTVELVNATMKVKENAGIFKVPILVTGHTNGPVQVTVDVEEVSASPAVEDVNYYVTSKTVTIPSDSVQVGIEIYVNNDMDVNEDRAFIVTIKSAEGAKLGSQLSTTVTIADDDGLFYEAIQGGWDFNAESYYGGDDNWKVTLIGVDEGQEGYEQTLYLSGLMGYAWVVAEVEYSYDAANNVISLAIPYGQIVATDVNFSGLGLCDVGLFGVVDGYLDEDGALEGVVSADLRSITFDEDADVIFYVLQGDEGMGAWDRILNISMSR